MSSLIQIDARFNGPPESANGGYTAGRIAAAIGETVKVRLVKPPPLNCDLTVSSIAEGRWEVRSAADLIAIATSTDVTVEAPQSVPYIEALGVSKHFVGFAQHTFPTCFVCGPTRKQNDGLRIFPGSVPGTSLVAAPWLPEHSLSDGLGKVRPEFIWAALDCPGYFSSASPDPALLGELAVHIDRPVHIDEPCVIVGWRIHVDGRKHYVGTALFDEEGERCALGAATWISLERKEAAG